MLGVCSNCFCRKCVFLVAYGRCLVWAGGGAVAQAGPLALVWGGSMEVGVLV